jgi:kynurenine formamidase
VNEVAEERRWSEFGTGDRRGALNYIDPTVILAATRLVKNGEVFSLNAPLDETPASVVGRPGLQRRPRQHNQLRPLGDQRYAVVNDDIIEFALQGSSHWDSFAHFGLIEPDVTGVFYGGAGIEETYPEPRAERLGIDAFATGIVTRGVLLDAVSALAEDGATHLPDELRIDAAGIETCLSRQDVTLSRGDCVLIYTGFERRQAKGDFGRQHAGIDGTTLNIWKDAQIAGLISDNLAVEAVPVDYSIHIGALRNLGILLGELWALEDLAMACRADGVYEFLLVSAPLNIPGAFGSPANALAIR